MRSNLLFDPGGRVDSAIYLGCTSSVGMPKRTMRAFDEMCLTPVEEMSPEEIRALRMRENASQAVFARHLNVTTGLITQVSGFISIDKMEITV